MRKAGIDGAVFLMMIQRLLPLLTSLFWLFVFYIPSDFLLSSNIRPKVAIICVYFWLLNRPDIFNLGSVFVLGIVEDVISSAPIGSNAFALLLLYILVTNLSKYFNSKPFSVMWYGFALLSFVVIFARWLVVSVYYSQFLPVPILLFSFLATIAFYPIISIANVFVQNNLIDDEV